MPDSNSNERNLTAFARRLREAVEARVPLDGSDERAESLRAEAATDHVRAALWQRQVVVDSAVDAARTDVPDVDLVDAVLAELGREAPATNAVSVEVAPPTGSARKTARWGLLVAAAALVVAVLVIRGPAPRPVDDDEPPITADRGTTPTPNPDPPRVDDSPVVVAEGSTELDRLFEGATVAYLGLANETRVVVADLGALMPSGRETLPAPPPMPAPVNEGRSWFDDFVPGSDDVGRTLDFLLEPVPGDGTTT